jgi:hypothetical protein
MPLTFFSVWIFFVKDKCRQNRGKQDEPTPLLPITRSAASDSFPSREGAAAFCRKPIKTDRAGTAELGFLISSRRIFEKYKNGLDSDERKIYETTLRKKIEL